MIKKTIFLFVFLISNTVFSQTINLDTYQYIVVADKFDFLKESDQYKTSSLTKFLLEKKMFKVYVSKENLPEALVRNRCLGLFASVKDESSTFTTKLLLEFKDCKGNVVYTSKLGTSKLKDYQKTYHEAIRNAFETMDDFVYSYNDDIQSPEKKHVKEVIIAKDISEKVVKNVMVTSKAILNSDNKKDEDILDNTLVVLYAQAIENGFQLVNTKPEVIFILLKTSLKDTFIIKDKNGYFYKNGDFWIAEYYKANKLVKEDYQVKF